jgi:hypothetical protein
VSTDQPSKGALRQKRYRERQRAKRNVTEQQSVTPETPVEQQSVTPSVTDSVIPQIVTAGEQRDGVTLNEDNELVDDPVVWPPMTPEEQQRNDAILAELSFE